ncbi:hypothetical protein MMC06_006775 [Schaereria dolodes]|nr:hypothetical protein [Schaereria dolodes]
MARTFLSALLLSALAVTAYAQSTATCNIDGVTFQTADASNACNAIPNTITVTGHTTVLATAPSNPNVAVYLTQNNLNWSGSSLQAKNLCKQIITSCGGTVGVAENNGASISTNGDFGGPGVISITATGGPQRRVMRYAA